MPTNLTGTVSPSISVNHSTTTGASVVNDQINQNPTLSFAFGTAANQCDSAFSSVGSLAASPTTIDFSSAGSLKDAFGNAVSFARLRLLYIYNQSTTDNFVLNIGTAATFPLTSIFGGVSTSKLTIAPGGFLVLYAPLTTGFVVTTGTACQLKLDPGANTVPYTLVALGCSV